MITFGAPSGARSGSGHHGVDSSSVRPTTPWNSLMAGTYDEPRGPGSAPPEPDPRGAGSAAHLLEHVVHDRCVLEVRAEEDDLGVLDDAHAVAGGPVED